MLANEYLEATAGNPLYKQVSRVSIIIFPVLLGYGQSYVALSACVFVSLRGSLYWFVGSGRQKDDNVPSM